MSENMKNCSKEIQDNTLINSGVQLCEVQEVKEVLREAFLTFRSVKYVAHFSETLRLKYLLSPAGDCTGIIQHFQITNISL